jgi:hypothetical protein
MTDLSSPSLSPRYSATETQTWLAWIARHMRRENQTIFLIEQLQPSWLATRTQRVLQLLLDSAALGALTGLILYLGWWLSQQLDPPTPLEPWIPLWIWMTVTAAWAFGMGLIDDARLPWLAPRPDRSRAANLAATVARLAVMFASWAAVWWIVQAMFGRSYAGRFGCGPDADPCGTTFGVYHPEMHLAHPLVSAAYIAVIYGSKIRGESTVKPVEALGWSWSSALKGLVVGGGAGLVVWLVYFGVRSFGGYEAAMLYPNLLLYPPIGAAGGFVIGGLSVRVVRDKFLPNQGMRLSLRNAGLAAAILAPVVGLATWPALVFTFDLSDPSKILTGVVTLGVIASLVGFAWFGGRELIMHASVRLVLAWTRQTPRDLAAFLDHCALDLDFLRKVGGGWVFLHRYLLEYFAALEPAQMTREAGAP